MVSRSKWWRSADKGCDYRRVATGGCELREGDEGQREGVCASCGHILGIYGKMDRVYRGSETNSINPCRQR